MQTMLTRLQTEQALAPQFRGYSTEKKCQNLQNLFTKNGLPGAELCETLTLIISGGPRKILRLYPKTLDQLQQMLSLIQGDPKHSTSYQLSPEALTVQKALQDASVPTIVWPIKDQKYPNGHYFIALPEDYFNGENKQPNCKELNKVDALLKGIPGIQCMSRDSEQYKRYKTDNQIVFSTQSMMDGFIMGIEVDKRFADVWLRPSQA